jgi:hypothetical protein
MCYPITQRLAIALSAGCARHRISVHETAAMRSAPPVVQLNMFIFHFLRRHALHHIHIQRIFLNNFDEE